MIINSLTAGYAALLLLRPSNNASSRSGEGASGAGLSAADGLIAIANGTGPTGSGQDSGGQVGLGLQSGATPAAISKSFFAIDAVDPAKLQLNLIDRTGKALGVRKEDFSSRDAFVTAMRDAVSKIKAQPNGDLALAGIEKDLGLDRLGLSIDDVIDAANNDHGKLRRALEEEVRKNGKGSDKAGEAAPPMLSIDASAGIASQPCDGWPPYAAGVSADFRWQANASPAYLFVLTQVLGGKPWDTFPEPA
jgi:hypothetical protein